MLDYLKSKFVFLFFFSSIFYRIIERGAISVVENEIADSGSYSGVNYLQFALMLLKKAWIYLFFPQLW